MPSDINATRLPFHRLNAYKKKTSWKHSAGLNQLLLLMVWDQTGLFSSADPGRCDGTGGLSVFVFCWSKISMLLEAPFLTWAERWNLVFVRQESVRYFSKTYMYVGTGMFLFFCLCMWMKANILCLLLLAVLNTSFCSLLAPAKLRRPETSLGMGVFAWSF